MPNLSASWAHLIIGLATIGAVAGLSASGTVPGSEAITVITGIAGVLLGTSATTVGASTAAVAAAGLIVTRRTRAENSRDHGTVRQALSDLDAKVEGQTTMLSGHLAWHEVQHESPTPPLPHSSAEEQPS